MSSLDEILDRWDAEERADALAELADAIENLSTLKNYLSEDQTEALDVVESLEQRFGGTLAVLRMFEASR